MLNQKTQADWIDTKTRPRLVVPRWQRYRMGRPLSPSQIHQKIIWMLSNFHKTILTEDTRHPERQLILLERRTKDWVNTKGDLAGCVQAPPHRQRQRGKCATARDGRQGATSAPENCILHQTVWRFPAANHVFPGSWTVDVCQEGHSLRSSPQGRHTIHLRQFSHSTPGKLSSLDWGGD